jgi:hypothetical protein
MMTTFKNLLHTTLKTSTPLALALSLLPTTATASDDVYAPGVAKGKVLEASASQIAATGVVCRDGFQFVRLKDVVGNKPNSKKQGSKTTETSKTTYEKSVESTLTEKEASLIIGSDSGDIQLRNTDVCDAHGGVATGINFKPLPMQCALGAQVSIDVSDDESLAEALDGTDRACDMRKACVAPPDGCVGPVIGSFPKIPTGINQSSFGTAHNSFLDRALGIATAVQGGSMALDPARFAELTDYVLSNAGIKDVQGLLKQMQPFMAEFEKLGGDNYAAYQALEMSCAHGVDADIECTQELVDFYGDHFLFSFNDLSGEEVEMRMLSAAKDAAWRLSGVDLKAATAAIEVGRGTNQYWRSATDSGTVEIINIGVELAGACDYCQSDFNGAVGGAIAGSLGGPAGAGAGALVGGASASLADAATDFVGWVTGWW